MVGGRLAQQEQDRGLPYREVLVPRPQVWLLPIGFGAALGIAYGYAYAPALGWLVGASASALLVAWMAIGGRTVIEVDPGGVRVGRARLPARHVGRVRALGAQEAFRARTIEADTRAYLVLRPWASPRAVVIEVIDPEDPHPYWLVSTRDPQRLADALTAAASAAGARAG